MAELQKLLQANGTFHSELMEAFLAANQQSFREHAKSGTGGSSSTVSHAPSHPAPPVKNAHLSASEVNKNALNDQVLLGAKDYLSADTPSPLQVPSPFPDFSTADFSPMNSELFDTKMFQGSMNMNGNSVYPQSPYNTVNSVNSQIDNLDPCDPAMFISYNNQMMSPDSSLDPANTAIHAKNLNNNCGVTSTNYSGASPHIMAPTGATPDNFLIPGHHEPTPDNMRANAQRVTATPDNITKMNLNSNLNAQPAMMANMHIKQEVVDTPADSQIDPADPDAAAIQENLNHINSSENIANVARIMAEVRAKPSEDRLLLISQVTDNIIDAHMNTTNATREKVNEAFATHNVNKMPDELPDMSKLKVTNSFLWQKFLSSMVPEISKVVKFSKKLPGFSEVSQDDQIKLIKQGSFEVMLARHLLLINIHDETMLDPTLSITSPRSVIRQGPMGQFLDEMFLIAKKVNPLELTDEEIGMLSAILLICPTRRNLDNQQSIKTIQQLYQQSLFIYMTSPGRDLPPEEAATRFEELMMLVALFQKVNNDHAKAINNIKMSVPEEQDVYKQFPDLHREVFDPTSQ